MKARRLGRFVDLARGAVLASGRDVVATTRDSLLSVEGRVGMSLFFGFWILGRYGAGGWIPWGPEQGGEILAVVRLWYEGRMVLVQAGLLAAHLFWGGLWGSIVKNAWGMVGYFFPSLAAERFRFWVVATVAGGVIFLAHGGVLLRDLARHPALYQETFLDRGGFPASVQIFSLKHLSGTGGQALSLAVGLLLFLAGGRWAQRSVRWFRRFPVPTRMAVGVLGGALVLFLAGMRFVVWSKSVRNDGPNLLFVSVDGLRADRNGTRQGLPELHRFEKRARVSVRAIPPSVDLTPSLATAWTGQMPLRHGFRHDFPSAADGAAEGETLPLFLRAHGWWTEFLSDGPAPCLARLGAEFDVAHVAPAGLAARLARRQLERSPHLMAYLSGPSGRRISLLRGSPFLADPIVLAKEADGILKNLQSHSRFFLWVHFSSPGLLGAVASPAAATGWAPPLPPFFRRPGDGLKEGPLSSSDTVVLQRLYDRNLRVLNESLEALFQSLIRRGLAGNTVVVLWSPRAALLSSVEETEARELRGPAFFELPLWIADVPLRPGGRSLKGGARSVDVASTVVRLLGRTPPAEWEGVSLTEERPAGEAAIVYTEGSTPFLRPSHTPPLRSLLVADRESPDTLHLDPAWEDAVLLFRPRSIQVGDERLFYRPGPAGVTFEYEDLTRNPQLIARTETEKAVLFTNNKVPTVGRSPAAFLASAVTETTDKLFCEGKRAEFSIESRDATGNFGLNRDSKALGRGKGDRWDPKREKEMREIFFRYLARESGWRPQNDYWIPEAFLRENPDPAIEQSLGPKERRHP